MEYRTGSMGRVIMVRFDNGDDLLEGLKEIVVKEKIASCWFQILGGIRRSTVVTGPEEPVMPPTPVWGEVTDAREALGTGSIHFDGDEPLIHLHSALGNREDTLTACLRKDTKVYLILEVILFEINGLCATRPWFDKGGFNRVTFS